MHEFEALSAQDVQRVEAVCQSLKNGGMAILLDEESRENEGDIIFAAEHVDAEKINFMAKHARGLICLAMESEMLDRLDLPMMTDTKKRAAPRETAFTVSIEASTGVTTGISAADRARTVEVAVSSDVRPEDIVVPGHVFPLRSQPGGVLQRAGHTEGSVDFCRLAGLKGASVICEVMNDDGTMARGPQLEELAQKFDLPLATIPELIRYRLQRESHVECVESREIRLFDTPFDISLYKSTLDGLMHAVVSKGTPDADQLTDVRVHVRKPLSDVFGEMSDDATSSSKSHLKKTLECFSKSNAAVLLYLSDDKPEFSILRDWERLTHSTSLSDQQPPSPYSEQDAEKQIQYRHRRIGIGSQILRERGVGKMRLHVNNANLAYPGLSGFGLEVVEQVPVTDSVNNTTRG